MPVQDEVLGALIAMTKAYETLLFAVEGGQFSGPDGVTKMAHAVIERAQQEVSA